MNETSREQHKGKLLVVSFGTSHADAREREIGGIEEAIRESYPGYTIGRAFTSRMVIHAVNRNEGQCIATPKEAIQEATEEGVTHLLIQPTHILNGCQYETLLDDIGQFQDQFQEIRIGSPLLYSQSDMEEIIGILRDRFSSYEDDRTGIVLIGHGTPHEANRIYHKMQDLFDQKGLFSYVVGTIEAEPDLQQVSEICHKRGFQRLVLVPFLIVAGDHALNDIAGDESGSWKNEFQKEGYEVVCHPEGMGALNGVQQMFLRHLKEAEEFQDINNRRQSLNGRFS